MTITRAFILIALAASAGAQEPGRDPLGDALRKAIVEEDVNHNPDAAIRGYQAILAQFHGERATAATALFRVAECYRKQGKTGEAAAAYRRLVAEFPEQQALVEKSRRQIPASERADANGTDPEVQRILEEKYQLAVQQLAQMKKRLELGTASETEIQDAQIAVLRAQIETLANRAAAAKGAAADNLLQQERVLLMQALDLAQANLVAEEKRFSLGVVPSETVSRRKAELLNLQQEMAISRRKGNTSR
jgi:outer membrane protein TolC